MIIIFATGGKDCEDNVDSENSEDCEDSEDMCKRFTLVGAERLPSG